MTPWWKVFLPLENDGGGRWISREVCIQADNEAEACKIAERVFIPKGYDLDDEPIATQISLKQLAEFRAKKG